MTPKLLSRGDGNRRDGFLRLNKMTDLVGPIASLPVSLAQKLRLLREQAAAGGRLDRLVQWAGRHPEIARGDDWCARVWWGAAAGELVREHLYDPGRRAVALDLLQAADFAGLDTARQQGGVIVLASHLGPPKFLMNSLLERNLPLLVWTNARDLPAWLVTGAQAAFLDPTRDDQRSVLLVKSALHLRDGGVLLGAADQATGDRRITLERLGLRWQFSLGLPALARRLDLPVVVSLALWRGERIGIECHQLPAPKPSLTEDEWYRAWLDGYWRVIEPVLRRSPENLRFLRWVVPRLVPPGGASASG